MRPTNIKLITTAIAVCATVLALNGCRKQEAAPAPSTAESPQASGGLAAQATNAVEAVKATATAVTEQAASQVKAAEEQAQTLIDRAKSLVAENKYQDALHSLGQLSSFKLTADQQKVVDGLKAQIQAALAKASTSSAASALGGALGGKK